MASIDRTIERIDARFDRIEAELRDIRQELLRLNGRLTTIAITLFASQTATMLAVVLQG